MQPNNSNKEKYRKFIDEVANDILKDLSDEDKEYIRAHPDSTTHHFGMGLAIRNRYIYGKDLNLDYYHPDDVSADITERVASLVIDNFDYSNPFYRYLYGSFVFNRMRRVYFSIHGEYPDKLMEEYAHAQDAREAAEAVAELLRKDILNPEEFAGKCQKYHLSKEKQEECKSIMDKYNEDVRYLCPYDVCLLASDELEEEYRDKLLIILRGVLEEDMGIATKLPAYVFHKKDAVLVAVNQCGASLERFKDYQSDDEVIRTALSSNGEAIEFVAEDIRYTPEYVRLALNAKYDFYCALKLPCMERFRDDDEIVRIALESNGCNIQYASERLKDDLETAKFAVTHQKNFYSDNTIRNLSPRLRDNLEIALLDIKKGHACVNSYSERLRDSDEVAKALIASGKEWRLYMMSNRIREKYEDKNDE